MQLYALCDQETLDAKEVSLEAFVTLCRKHNASIIQYRNKSSDIANIKNRLIALRKLWDGILIVNDAMTLTPFCDGIHLGQEDLHNIDTDINRAVTQVREHIGSDKWLGISTHNKEEILQANSFDVNYIGLGAYRTTSTKEVGTILGESLDLLAQLSTHDVAAIGGVRLDDSFEYVTYRVIGSALYEN